MATSKRDSSKKVAAQETSGRTRGARAKGTQNRGLMKAVQSSPELATIVGSQPIPRTEITKRVWDYIKDHNLQDPKNKRLINADAKLRPVFGGKQQVSMFELTKLVSGHLT